MHLLPFTKVKVRRVVATANPRLPQRTTPACSWLGSQSQGPLREGLSFMLLCALDPGLGTITPCTGDSTSLQGSQPTCISYLCFGEEETRDRRARAACPRSCLGRRRAAPARECPSAGSPSPREKRCLSQQRLLHFLCLVRTFLRADCKCSAQGGATGPWMETQISDCPAR